MSEQQQLILYSIHKDGRIVVRLNQGKNTKDSRDLIERKTNDTLFEYKKREPFVMPDPDDNGANNILINVVEKEKMSKIVSHLTKNGFVNKNEELSDIFSKFGIKEGGSRKSNKSSKIKKYKTTKNKKNKKPTKHKKTKKTKKNKKTRR